MFGGGKGGGFDDVFQTIAERFRVIVRDLNVGIDIDGELAAVREGMFKTSTADFAAATVHSG